MFARCRLVTNSISTKDIERQPSNMGASAAMSRWTYLCTRVEEPSPPLKLGNSILPCLNGSHDRCNHRIGYRFRSNGCNCSSRKQRRSVPQHISCLVNRSILSLSTVYMNAESRGLDPSSDPIS